MRFDERFDKRVWGEEHRYLAFDWLLFYCRTLGKAWQSLKAELRHRSEAHTKFAEKVCTSLMLETKILGK